MFKAAVKIDTLKHLFACCNPLDLWLSLFFLGLFPGKFNSVDTWNSFLLPFMYIEDNSVDQPYPKAIKLPVGLSEKHRLYLCHWRIWKWYTFWIQPFAALVWPYVRTFHCFLGDEVLKQACHFCDASWRRGKLWTSHHSSDCARTLLFPSENPLFMYKLDIQCPRTAWCNFLWIRSVT